MAITLDADYYKLLYELQAADFVLVELNLYLDTHPWDTAALQQQQQYVKLRQKIAQTYETKYGPLTVYGGGLSDSPWQWIEAPWPWQV